MKLSTFARFSSVSRHLSRVRVAIECSIGGSSVLAALRSNVMTDLNPIVRKTITAGPVTDERLDLVHRVAGSPLFKESKRLRELFLFLCERALIAPGVIIHEQEVGVEVFGRPADYDTTEDTLVRVHASRLRKKLQQYFSSEGRHEPVTVEVPRGSYTPVFRARDPQAPEDKPICVAEPSSRSGRKWLKPLFAVPALCAVVLITTLTLTHLRSEAPLTPVMEPRPTVDRLWRQIFANGRQTCLVLSDSTLTMFEDLLHRQIDLNEYRKKEFAQLADEGLTNPEQKAMAKVLMAKFFTHIADAHTAWRIERLNGAHQVPIDVVFARDFAISYLQSHNVILLGSRRANPWLELFENQLNFRSEFQEQPPVAYFQNHSPLPGEQTTYRGLSWEREGYCRVAFLPNLTRGGNVLVISGTSLASTEAGGEFITSERWIQALRSALGLSKQARFPYFEVLLKVELMQAATRQFEIVAHRIPTT